MASKKNAFHDDWLKRCERRSHDDLPDLLATLSEQCTVKQGAERLALLASWPPDGELLLGALKTLRNPAWTSSSSRPFWVQLCLLVLAHVEAVDPSRLDKALRSPSPRLDENTRESVAELLRRLHLVLKDLSKTGPPGDLDTDLARAAEACAQQRWLEAEEHLCSAWRTTRDADLGRCIKLIGERAKESREPFPSKHRHQHWLTRARELHPGDIPDLMAELPRGHASHCEERLRLLLAEEPHAAIGAGCAGLAANPPWNATLPISFVAYACAFQHGDANSVEYWQSQASDNLYCRLLASAVSNRLSRKPALSDSQQELIRACAVALGLQRSDSSASQEDELLEAVYRAPDDLEGRAVYADWLAEHGQPRGELMHLQLGRHGRSPSAQQLRQENKLIKEHFRDWVGTLAPVLRAPGAGDGKYTWFENGFLASCGGRRASKAVLKARMDDRAWRTVTELHLDEDGQDACKSPQLVSLRRLENLRLSQHQASDWRKGGRAARPLVALAERLRSLELDLAWVDGKDDVLQAIAEACRLDELMLRSWSLERYRAWSPRTPARHAVLRAFGAEAIRALKRVGLSVSSPSGALGRDEAQRKKTLEQHWADQRDQLDEWLGVLNNIAPELESVRLYLGPSSRDPGLELRRDAQGRRTVGCYQVPNPCLDRSPLASLVAVLDGLPELTELTIEAPGRKWKGADRQRIEAALQGHRLEGLRLVF